MSSFNKTFHASFNYFRLILLVYLFHLFYFGDNYNIIPINGFYPKIKQLPSGEYFIILNDGIYIYNNDFSKIIRDFKFQGVIENLEDKKTTISEFKNNNYFYILCLIKDYLYLFNFNKTSLEKIDLTEYLSGNSYNLIPYKYEDDPPEIFNFIICYMTIIDSEQNYLKFYNFQINSNDYKYKKLSSKEYKQNYKEISDLNFSCEFVLINQLYYLICFYLTYYNEAQLACDSKLNIKKKFRKEKDICYNYNGNIKAKQIKSIFIEKDLLVCFYEKYNNHYLYDIYPYDYYNNKWKKSIYIQSNFYTTDFEFHNLNESSYYINYIMDNELITYKINYKSNEILFDYKSFDKTWNLYQFYLNYNGSIDEFSLIGSFYDQNNKWNIIYNLSLFSYSSESPPITDLPEFSNNNEEFNQTHFRENKKEEENYNININKTKDYILNNLDEIIESIEIGKSYEIKGEDFTLSIRPVNATINESKTHIDFTECAETLRQNFNLSDSSILTVLQLEINNNNNKSFVNQLEYLIYDEDINPLNLSICKDSNIRMFLKLKDNVLNYTNYNSYKNKGIDIFNIYDSFFNDICHPYSDSKNDIVLEDRIKYIYQNYSLCNEGCTYIDFNSDFKTVSCDCKVKTNLSFEEEELNIKLLDEIKIDSNFGIIKCYNLVFSFARKSKNIGFWIFLILIIVHIPILFLYFYKGIKPIRDFIINEMKKYGYINDKKIKINLNKKNIIHKVKNRKSFHSPPKKSIKLKGRSNKKESSSLKFIKSSKREIIENMNDKKENNKSINKAKIYKKKNKNGIKNIESLPTQEKEKKKINKKKRRGHKKNMNKKETTKLIDFNLINININNIKEYIPSNSYYILNNYTFEEAIKYDMRSICAIFYIFLLSKQAAFHAFLFKSPLESFPLRLCLLIFIISSDLALNAFFYLDDKISKKYKYSQNLFLFTFNNNITIILLSTLIGFVFMTLFTNLSNSTNQIRDIFRKEEEKIKKNKTVTTKRKIEIINEVEKILKKHKIKVIILITIEILLMLFFWYYVTAFCHVYSSTQLSWLLDSFLSILSRLIIEILISLGFAKLYRIAVESNTHCIYKFVLFFYCFG